MATTTEYKNSISGVISTDKTVLQNLETLLKACQSWLTFDIHTGLYSVVINRAGNSVASFGSDNILGAITVSSTGLTELYNSVKVEFPHVDLRDSPDYVTLTIPDADRNTAEPDNELVIQLDCINDPIQAEYIAFVELKQNRLDQVIKFTTDFTSIGLRAGDIIDVTSTAHAYTAKKFRIVSIVENDNDDNSITLDITALEYDDNIYSTDDLYRYIRSDSTGITSIGSIGVPGTPQIYKFESNSRPHILLETTAPIGVVNSIEYWYSTDSEVVYDENRNYTLLGVQTPTLGNTFTAGETVTFDYDGGTIGNLFVKTRGVNKDAAGPFSNTASFVYSPVQVTDAIGPNTAAVDESGNDLLTVLGGAGGASLLLGALDKLFSSNSAVYTGSDSIWPKILDGFLTKDTTAYPQILSNQYYVPGSAGGNMISYHWSNYTVASNAINDTSTHTYYMLSPTIVMPVTGTYIAEWTLNILGTFDDLSYTAFTVGMYYNSGGSWVALTGALSSSNTGLPGSLSAYSYGNLPAGTEITAYIAINSTNYNYGHTYGFDFFQHSYISQQFI